MSYALGIDLGTSSLKGILVNKTGEILATASSEYPLIHLQSGYSEQEPAEWLKAFHIVVEKIGEKIADFKENIEGISFSGQMHSLVLLDEEGKVLRPAILWNDTRTTDQCEIIRERLGKRLLCITKNQALEGFTLPKILWVQEHESEIWNQARHILLPKDYLSYYLTGEYCSDYSDAAGTLLLDVEKSEWSQVLADEFEIPLSYLPKVIGASDEVGVVKSELQKKFGFAKEVKIFAGGADNACAAVGAGIVCEGIALASIGTSGVFLSYEGINVPDYQGKLHYFNHALPSVYYSMGVTLTAGYSLSWFKDTFAKGMDYAEVLSGIKNIVPGCDGLTFAPYLLGERTPHADSKVRASFTGIDASHTFDHFARAVLEGITFSLKDSQTLMASVAHKSFSKIVSVGGGAKNPDWIQMQADIFGADIVTLSVEQGPGLGAAMLAALGLGWFDSIQDCVDIFVEYSEPVSPISKNVEKYEEIYNRFKSVYPLVKNILS